MLCKCTQLIPLHHPNITFVKTMFPLLMISVSVTVNFTVVVYSICLSSPEVVFVEWFRIRKIPFRIPRNFKLNSENSEKSSTNCSARLWTEYKTG